MELHAMEIVARGEGPLFMDPDPDKAREFFRTKTRALVNKVTTVRDAVARFVHDGEYLAIGGFGANRIPAAVCHEIVRQGRKRMAFAGHTSTHDFQILAAGEVFDRCDSAYIVGLEARGLSPNARRYMESGKVTPCEWTNYALALRLKAAAMGVAFVPGRNMLGTDTFRRSAALAARCPFTGKIHALYPALWPDVAAIHVHEADVFGNCRIRGISVADLELSRAAKRLIITAERLVSTDEIRSDPTRTFIPYYLVDAVCEVSYGGYPGSVSGEYFSDEEHLRLWLELEKDPAKFRLFFDEYIRNTKDFDEYLQKCGGLAKLRKLHAEELLLDTGKAEGRP